MAYLLFAIFIVISIYQSIVFSSHQWTDLTAGQMELVRDQQFFNQSVEIDGKHFVHCTFINAQLIFQGKKSFILDGNAFSGTLSIKTDDSASANLVRQLEAFLTSFGMVSKGSLALDQNANVILFLPSK